MSSQPDSHDHTEDEEEPVHRGITSVESFGDDAQKEEGSADLEIQEFVDDRDIPLVIRTHITNLKEDIAQNDILLRQKE